MIKLALQTILDLLLVLAFILAVSDILVGVNFIGDTFDNVLYQAMKGRGIE